MANRSTLTTPYRTLCRLATAAALALGALLTVPSISPSQPAHASTRPNLTHVTVVGGSSAVSQRVVTALSRGGGDTWRVSGTDRYRTAAAVSSHAFPNGAPVVYLAVGTNFPDALAAAAAAGAQGGPVLLTQTATLPGPVAVELARLNPPRVIVVGGPAAITPDLETELRVLLPGATLTRVSGTDRYRTAAAVSSHAFPNGAPVVYLAVGTNFPDALAAAAAAGAQGGPVLLTQTATLPGPVAVELARLRPSRVVVMGGTAVVSDQVVHQVRALIPQVALSRAAGTNRYQTAVAAADQNVQRAYLASGVHFADALVAAAAAAVEKVPVLLTEPTMLPHAVRHLLPDPEAARMTPTPPPTLLEPCHETMGRLLTSLLAPYQIRPPLLRIDPTRGPGYIAGTQVVTLPGCVDTNLAAHELGHYILDRAHRFNWSAQVHDARENFCPGGVAAGRCRSGWITAHEWEPGIEHAAHCIGHALVGSGTYTLCPDAGMRAAALERIRRAAT